MEIIRAPFFLAIAFLTGASLPGELAFVHQSATNAMVAAQETSAPADVVDSYDGHLAEGRAYRAAVWCDKEHGFLPVIPLHVAYHQAARIEWEDLSKLPKLRERKCQRSILFRVLSKETRKVPGRNQWRVTYHCQIIEVE